MTCSVTGTLVDPSGAALPDTYYTLTRSGGIVGATEGTVIPKVIAGATGVGGAFSEGLI